MKFLKYILPAAAAISMISCSQDSVEDALIEGESTYNITVQLPGDFGTRSFGDGMAAENLHVAIFNADNDELIDTKDFTFDNSNLKNISLTLVNGRSYKLAFFAQSPASDSNGAYTFDVTNKEIRIDYSKIDGYNLDSYDCFYSLVYTGKIGTDPQDAVVELTRPVAQVNWGTDDLHNPAITSEENYGAGASKLVSKVSAQAYTTLDMMTGDVKEGSGKTEVNFGYLSRPAASETFPVKKASLGEGEYDYEYISMQYLLVPKAGDVIDLKITVNNDAGSEAKAYTLTVGSAPVQANHRTNIYGSLLTNPDNYTIIKNQE